MSLFCVNDTAKGNKQVTFTSSMVWLTGTGLPTGPGGEGLLAEWGSPADPEESRKVMEYR